MFPQLPFSFFKTNIITGDLIAGFNSAGVLSDGALKFLLAGDLNASLSGANVDIAGTIPPILNGDLSAELGGVDVSGDGTINVASIISWRTITEDQWRAMTESDLRGLI